MCKVNKFPDRKGKSFWNPVYLRYKTYRCQNYSESYTPVRSAVRISGFIRVSATANRTKSTPISRTHSPAITAIIFSQSLFRRVFVFFIFISDTLFRHAESSLHKSQSSQLLSGLVVEKSDSCECHSDIVLVAGLDNVVIADRAAGFCNVSNA